MNQEHRAVEPDFMSAPFDKSDYSPMKIHINSPKTVTEHNAETAEMSEKNVLRAEINVSVCCISSKSRCMFYSFQ